MKHLQLCVLVLLLDGSVSLNHGQSATVGELPYILRISVSEDSTGPKNSTVIDDAATAATGVLISPIRILTTCDSVGFFTGQKVNLYKLSRVTIVGGSVMRDGAGGQKKIPTFSSAHPYCYSLLVSKTVLFNYGIYMIGEPFDNEFVSPIKNIVTSKRDMEITLRRMWELRTVVKCVTAGWGNPRKQFEGNGMPDLFERFSEVLQTTPIRIVTYPECYSSTCINFNDCLISIFEFGFVCAKAPQGGPCDDDYGSPLVCGGQLYALHTNPQKCEDAGLPRHFLRIDLAYDYVFDTQSKCEARVADAIFVIAVLMVTLWHQAMV